MHVFAADFFTHILIKLSLMEVLLIPPIPSVQKLLVTNVSLIPIYFIDDIYEILLNADNWMVQW